MKKRESFAMKKTLPFFMVQIDSRNKQQQPAQVQITTGSPVLWF